MILKVKRFGYKGSERQISLSLIFPFFSVNHLITRVFIIFHTFVLSLSSRIKELTESNYILPFTLLASISFQFGRQCGRVVRASDLKSVGRGYKSRSDR